MIEENEDRVKCCAVVRVVDRLLTFDRASFPAQPLAANAGNVDKLVCVEQYQFCGAVRAIVSLLDAGEARSGIRIVFTFE